ncbi:hypothetical protein RB195_006965 [Necator americanus]|uniref:Uncharacterized protein n=1 Tax=Necator americanus TaxID=51031 RepID=A0ABR1BV13_NECAM
MHIVAFGLWLAPYPPLGDAPRSTTTERLCSLLWSSYAAERKQIPSKWNRHNQPIPAILSRRNVPTPEHDTRRGHFLVAHCVDTHYLRPISPNHATVRDDPTTIPTASSPESPRAQWS